MDWTLLSWAFLAGAAATVNPCGLAMLPAYVSYYVGRNEGDTHPGRGLAAGLLLSLGTLSVFTLMGLVITSLGTAVARFVPWLALLVAVLLLIAGVATLLGRAPAVLIGRGRQAPVKGSPSSFVGFGVGYGLASLGCTLPIFMIVASQVFSAAFVTGLLAFVAYGLGMGAVLTGISLAVALGKTAVLRYVRAAGPVLKVVGGLGLVIAGSYLITYNVDGLILFQQGRNANLPLYLGVGAFVASLVAMLAFKVLTRKPQRFRS